MSITPNGDIVAKLIVLGNGQVGKSSLCSSLINKEISTKYDITVGVEIHTHDIDLYSTGDKIKLVLWDLAGQDRFGWVRPGFYEGSRVALIVFDLQNRGSFYDVQHWVRELKKSSPHIPFILIGNKSDINKREVTKEEGKLLANNLGVPYIETSALEGSNVQETFKIATSIALRGSVVAG